MPRSKTGNKRPPVDPQSINNAIKAVNAPYGKKISFREACKIYNVSLSTLSRQLKVFKESGAETYSYCARYDVRRIFSEEEEATLIKYIMTIAKMQYGLTKKRLRQIAYRYAKANKKKYPKKWDIEKIAGEEWMRLFIRRHKDKLSIRKPEEKSLAQALNSSRNNVKIFFDNLYEIHKQFGPIPAERIWNSDETHFEVGQKSSKISSTKDTKQIDSLEVSIENDNRVTMIAAVNAAGNYIPPMLIFPRFNSRKYLNKEESSVINPSGRSNEMFFTKFLEHFISHTKPSKEEKLVLIIDSHESHLSIETLQRASDAGVIMLTLPPHTSNKLQPLILSVFGPLKAFYDQGVETWLKNNPGKTYDLYSVVEVLGIVYPRAFSKSNIIKGFRDSGICCLDENRFSDEKGLPSKQLSYKIKPNNSPLQEDSKNEIPLNHTLILDKSNLDINLDNFNSKASTSESTSLETIPEKKSLCSKVIACKTNKEKTNQTIEAYNSPKKEKIKLPKIFIKSAKERQSNFKTIAFPRYLLLKESNEEKVDYACVDDQNNVIFLFSNKII